MPDGHILFQSMKSMQKSLLKLSYPPSSLPISPTHKPLVRKIGFVSLSPARNFNASRTSVANGTAFYDWTKYMFLYFRTKKVESCLANYGI